MKLIESIDSISPTELVFNLKKLDEKLTPNVELEIKVGMQVEDLKSDDQGNFIAVVVFVLKVDDEEEDLFKLSHQIDFSSFTENFDLKDKEFNFALFEIVEPYIRFRFNELLSQTKFSSLDIPYSFWEKLRDDSEI